MMQEGALTLLTFIWPICHVQHCHGIFALDNDAGIKLRDVRMWKPVLAEYTDVVNEIWRWPITSLWQ